MAKSLGALVDELFALDQKLDKLNQEHNRKEKALKAQRDALEEQLLKRFKKETLNGASGVRSSLERKISPMPNVKDWDSYLAFVAKRKAWELIHKRVGVTAFREYLEKGVKIPGVDVFDKVELVTRPLKKRKR